ncbi:hypothetical protein D6821_01025 [Candidatus Parcubacteria bacterium]|nr:MAG: hypothetical protein D6821_01025 [Candidatus Parcubacteria bacterium]
MITPKVNKKKVIIETIAVLAIFGLIGYLLATQVFHWGQRSGEGGEVATQLTASAKVSLQKLGVSQEQIKEAVDEFSTKVNEVLYSPVNIQPAIPAIPVGKKNPFTGFVKPKVQPQVEVK